MKKTTCRVMRGACDAEITGSTADEMIANCKQHVSAVIANGNQAHQAAMESMMKLSQDEQIKWSEDWKNNFDNLENV